MKLQYITDKMNLIFFDKMIYIPTHPHPSQKIKIKNKSVASWIDL